MMRCELVNAHGFLVPGSSSLLKLFGCPQPCGMEGWESSVSGELSDNAGV